MGMQLAWEKGFKKVEFESDISHLIGLLQSGLAPLSKDIAIQEIHVLCGKEWPIYFRCIRRSFNTVANKLAKIVAYPMGHLAIFHVPPKVMEELCIWMHTTHLYNFLAVSRHCLCFLFT